MVNPNRIEEYNFTVGSLIAGAATVNTTETIDAYTSYPINGFLLAVQLLENNFASSGSLYLNVSGTEETLWNLNGADVSGTFYPRAQVRFTDGVLASGTGYTEVDRIALNSVLHLAGSDLTASKSGLGINIVYSK